MIDKAKLLCPCCGKGKKDLKPELLDRLETLQAKWGRPLNFTSGYRCPAHNEVVKGGVNSAHLTGYAVDIACNNSTEVFKLVQTAIMIFNRVGVSSKNKSHFVHLDCSPRLPQYVLWSY